MSDFYTLFHYTLVSNLWYSTELLTSKHKAYGVLVLFSHRASTNSDIVSLKYS